MDKRLLMKGADGTATYASRDHASKKVTFISEQEVAPALDENERLQNSGTYHFAGDWGRRVASIPTTVLIKHLAAHNITWHQWSNGTLSRADKRKILFPLIYDLDNKKLLTAPHNRKGGGSIHKHFILSDTKPKIAEKKVLT